SAWESEVRIRRRPSGSIEAVARPPVGAPRAVGLVVPDATTPGLSTLSCVKAKGEPAPDGGQRFRGAEAGDRARQGLTGCYETNDDRRNQGATHAGLQ